MKLKASARVLSVLLLAVAGTAAFAQGPGGGHPPGGSPGGHGPGGPPGAGNQAPPGSGPNGGPNNGGNTGGTANGPSAPRGNIVSSSGVKLGPPGRWWDDRTVTAAIGLRRDQQKKMDAIFNANKGAIVSTYQVFEKQQATLTALSSARVVDKQKVFAAIDGLNQARAALQKANTEMLLEVRQQLDADQVVKLEKLP